MLKLAEYTGGSHIYMKMKLDNGRIEEIDVFIRDDGMYYRTSADYGSNTELREEIIKAFHELY